jgi:hypothetical protein
MTKRAHSIVRLGVWMAAILLGVGQPGYGSMIVASENWNAPGLAGWTSDEPWVTLSNPGAGGVGNSGYLNIALDATSSQQNDPGAEWYALAKVQASSLFAGNWQGLQVSFDFWADDVQPQYVQVRWASSTNASVWRSTVFDSGTSSMATQRWTTLTAPSLVNSLDWDYGSGNQQQFIGDLATIDWIGVYIWRDTGLSQQYGLDELRLSVPEPAEYMMLAAALSTALLSLRGRLGRRDAGPAKAA